MQLEEGAFEREPEQKHMEGGVVWYAVTDGMLRCIHSGSDRMENIHIQADKPLTRENLR